MKRDAEAGGGRLTLLCARLVIAARPLSLVLLTPAEADAFEIWAVNRRAFEIAATSAEPAGQ